MGVTINDVARKAKVSPSTVSRVIANNPRISSETRQNVIKVMQEMNYHPNIIARSLANKSTKIIGVIVPGTTEKAFQHPFFPEILRGIDSVANKNKFNILISSFNDIEEEKDTIKKFAKGGITEGIILLTSRVNDPSIKELTKINFPFVVVGRPENDNEVNWVDNNNFQMGYRVTEHFIKQGYKKIAFLGANPQFIVTLDRVAGYRKALQDYDLHIDEKLIIESRFIDGTGYTLMKQLLDTCEKPEGVIACDDLLAFGAMKYARESKLKIPKDIAVAGFNNVQLSEYLTPSLTSVEINAFCLGAKAGELLLDSINSEFKSYNRVIVPSELIIRGSSPKRDAYFSNAIV